MRACSPPERSIAGEVSVVVPVSTSAALRTVPEVPAAVVLPVMKARVPAGVRSSSGWQTGLPAQPVEKGSAATHRPLVAL